MRTNLERKYPRAAHCKVGLPCHRTRGPACRGCSGQQIYSNHTLSWIPILSSLKILNQREGGIWTGIIVVYHLQDPVHKREFCKRAHRSRDVLHLQRLSTLWRTACTLFTGRETLSTTSICRLSSMRAVWCFVPRYYLPSQRLCFSVPTITKCIQVTPTMQGNNSDG
jgi:hypothetical protein